MIASYPSYWIIYARLRLFSDRRIIFARYIRKGVTSKICTFDVTPFRVLSVVSVPD